MHAEQRLQRADLLQISTHARARSDRTLFHAGPQLQGNTRLYLQFEQLRECAWLQFNRYLQYKWVFLFVLYRQQYLQGSMYVDGLPIRGTCWRQLYLRQQLHVFVF